MSSPPVTTCTRTCTRTCTCTCTCTCMYRGCNRRCPATQTVTAFGQSVTACTQVTDHRAQQGAAVRSLARRSRRSRRSGRAAADRAAASRVGAGCAAAGESNRCPAEGLCRPGTRSGPGPLDWRAPRTTRASLPGAQRSEPNLARRCQRQAGRSGRRGSRAADQRPQAHHECGRAARAAAPLVGGSI